jgi:hypothetical protein
MHPVPETVQRAVSKIGEYRKTEAAAQRPGSKQCPKRRHPLQFSLHLKMRNL